MLKIEKLPSGSYRVRKMFRGKSYQVVFDYKPTQRDALEALTAEIRQDGERTSRRTFGEAAEKMISLNDGVLRQSTVREYTRLLDYFKKHYSEFCATPIKNISKEKVQAVVNHYAKNTDPRRKKEKRSPKTVRNFFGFISAVFTRESPDTKLRVALPQKVKVEPYIPTDKEVKSVIEALRGSKYEVAIALAAMGMRRSEICALSADDLEGNIITIDKAKIYNRDKKWIIEHVNKTTESTRKIIIPDSIADQIRKEGCVYEGGVGTLTQTLHKIQNRLNIPQFSIHKLRHYYASSAHTIGVPDAYIMRAGGWKTDKVLKAVYRHAQKDKLYQMDMRAVKHIEEILS